MVYDQSDKLRKRFDFIFEAVSNKMRSSLTEQRKSMNLTELKRYGEDAKEIRKYNFNRLSKIATNMATISLVDSKTYDDVAKRIENEFANAFFEYPSYKMNSFVNKMETLSEEVLDSIESTNQFQSCQNEESICEDHLRNSYNFVFQPFEMNKFPYETLGFGTYMAYFSRFLLNKPETQVFLGRKKLLQEEQWVRAYQSEVFGNLSGQDVGKMSIMEFVQILHHNPKENEQENILSALKTEANCEEEFLDNYEIPCMKYYFLTQFHSRTTHTQRELFFQKLKPFGLGQTNWADIL